MVLVKRRQLAANAPAFNLPPSAFDASIGVIPFEFCLDFRRQKTRICGISRRCLRDPTFSRFTRTPTCDRRTDRRTDTRRQLIPALASVARVKIDSFRLDVV